MSAAAQQRQQEPSMEEILASIRKIIADDTGQAKPPAPVQAAAPIAAAPKAVAAPAPLRPSPPGNDDDDILELKPSARRSQPHYLADDPVPLDLHFADPEAQPAPPETGQVIAAIPEPPPPPAPASTAILPPPVIAAPPPVAEHTPEPQRLISDAAEAAVSHSFGNLASTILSGNARTLEDLVREMLKPMIKTWLDDNLPTMVERLVRAEIERVARGGRS
jgi:hypothetical protein